jgi:hypothetical protein
MRRELDTLMTLAGRLSMLVGVERARTPYPGGPGHHSDRYFVKLARINSLLCIDCHRPLDAGWLTDGVYCLK